jgi:beta-N-acetylhexosaminidase
VDPRIAAGQVLVAGFPPDRVEDVRSAASRGEIGGIVLFKRNVGPIEEVQALIAGLAAAAPADLPLLVAVDQEGGRVARLGPPVLRLPPMRKLGEHDDPALTRRAARVLGAQLRAIGFTMDFAPVLDVDTNPQNPVIGDRSFGRTAETVARHGLAFAGGLAEAGLLSCGKHFPGHGDTETDSHLALPRLGHGRDRLDAIELAPFRAAAALPAVMTAHVVFDAVEPGVPATLSRRAVTGLLRGELGFRGAIVSDDLEMRAVRDLHPIPDAAVLAIEAGCDLLLVCSDVDAMREAHRALEARARADDAFAARLRDAAARSLALRTGPRPPPLPLGEALSGPDARAVGDEVARLA